MARELRRKVCCSRLVEFDDVTACPFDPAATKHHHRDTYDLKICDQLTAAVDMTERGIGEWW
jgi:hypothetical protein